MPIHIIRYPGYTFICRCTPGCFGFWNLYCKRECAGFLNFIYVRECGGCSIATAPASAQLGGTPWPNAQACTRFTHTLPPTPQPTAHGHLHAVHWRPSATAPSTQLDHLPPHTHRTRFKSHSPSPRHIFNIGILLSLSNMPNGDCGLPTSVCTNG